MPRDILSPTSDESLVFRAAEMFRRRRLVAILVFAAVAAVEHSHLRVSPRPVSRDGESCSSSGPYLRPSSALQRHPHRRADGSRAT